MADAPRQLEPVLDETRRELGLAEAAPIAALSPAELTALRDLMRGARASQKASLDHAIEHSLEAVPRVLRGAIRKVLFP